MLDKRVPLLMRKSAMKLACIKLDLQNDAATIWGSKFC